MIYLLKRTCNKIFLRFALDKKFRDKLKDFIFEELEPIKKSRDSQEYFKNLGKRVGKLKNKI